MSSVWLWPLVAGGVFAVAVVVWLATRQWYAKKLVAAAQRLARSDQGRLVAQKQVAQAVQQMQALRRELEAERQRAVRNERETFESRWTATETFTPVDAPAPRGGADFADTQILA